MGQQWYLKTLQIGHGELGMASLAGRIRRVRSAAAGGPQMDRFVNDWLSCGAAT